MALLDENTRAILQAHNAKIAPPSDPSDQILSPDDAMIFAGMVLEIVFREDKKAQFVTDFVRLRGISEEVSLERIPPTDIRGELQDA